MRMASPVTVIRPAIVPSVTATTWYRCSEMPTASVQVAGTSRPPTWPASASRMPMWNRGLPRRSSLVSYICEDRVVQPNLS